MDDDLSYNMQKTFTDSIKMSFFSNFKTNNILIDTIISTLLITFITFFMQKISLHNIQLTNIFLLYDNIKSIFIRKYSISFEGRQSFVVTKYEPYPTITACFSDNFKALFYDIIKTTKNNNSVYDIQEYITSSNRRYSNEIEADMYIIKQTIPILYDKELAIYAYTEVEKEDGDTDKKATIKTDNITITLYSYKSTIPQIQDFVDNIKKRYLEYIENDRKGKRFVYSLKKKPNEDDDGNMHKWNETVFESTRTFSNMIFQGKDEVLEKINFFINNKSWYYENGIPYTLGIGLYGPPGTGKTSFFKSLANLTGRHLVILSLKELKTKQQLEECFFESRYNYDNKKDSVGFDKKIIIIEDIDCLGEVVWKRDAIDKKKSKTKKNKSPKDNVGVVIQQLIENNNNEKNEFIEMCKKQEEDPITLDDILNLWDGIKETPGRILGISSNHYDKLDPALIRPGRIDITLCLDNCTRNMLRQMYKQYYKCDIDERQLSKVKDKFFSPAEVINVYVLNRENPKGFMDFLLKGQKIETKV
jgi:ATPase family associated with various cellular activities (AAA)